MYAGFFAAFINLVEIDFSYNALDKIPDDIAQLPNIMFLHCDGNKIKTVPTAVMRLSRLQNAHIISKQYFPTAKRVAINDSSELC